MPDPQAGPGDRAPSYSAEQQRIWRGRIVTNAALALVVALAVAMIVQASVGRFLIWSSGIILVAALFWWGFVAKGARPLESRGLSSGVLGSKDWWRWPHN